MLTLDELKNSFDEQPTKNELEQLIIRERAFALAFNGAVFEKIPASLFQLCGGMACERKFYNYLWSLNEGRPGLALGRNEILDGDWSRQPLKLPTTRRKKFFPKYPSKEFLYYALLRQECGFGQQLTLDLFEQSLFCLRMRVLVPENHNFRVLRLKEEWPDFAKDRRATLLLLRELYQDQPQNETIVEAPFLVTGVAS